MRIVQLANLVHPTSGGVRTVLRRLAHGYAASGHEVHLVAPAPGDVADLDHGPARVHLLPGAPLPGRAGYRLVWRRGPLRRLLDELAPDALELSDRWTLPWTTGWARARGVRSTLLGHERLDLTLATWLPGPDVLARGLARQLDRRLDVDEVVAPSGWVAASLRGLGPVHRVAWGVDLAAFNPDVARPAPGRPGRDRPLRLAWVGRLSSEKQPGLAVGVLAHLRASGVPAELVVVGDGPLRPRLVRAAHDLPLRLTGHLPDPAAVAVELASADVTLATCPIEAFGLAALESLACGTPVVTVPGGGVAELLDPVTTPTPQPGAVVTAGTPDELADAALRVVRTPGVRASARAHAEAHPWARTVDALLALHAGGHVPAGC